MRFETAQVRPSQAFGCTAAPTPAGQLSTFIENGTPIATLLATVDTSLGITRICYTLTRVDTGPKVIDAIGIQVCPGLTCPDINIAAPAFSEPGTPCPAAQDAFVAFDTFMGVCQHEVFFGLPGLDEPGDCRTVCLTYNSLLQTTDNATVFLRQPVDSTFEFPQCTTIGVLCPEVPRGVDWPAAGDDG